MKKLILAEKPSVARDIAKVVGASEQKNGYIEGKQYVVTWALGHLVTLATPDQYDKKYATWKIEDLPMLPKHLRTTVIPKTRKQFNTVKAQLNRKDVQEVIIATDAGREGELVARWILKEARSNKPCKRLWISSVTNKAIKEGFAKLQDAKKYDHLYEAAVARSEADWYVGLNATRALTTKFDAQLSAGRVQTPTLAMVRERENQINTFKPKAFYEIEATINGHTFRSDLGRIFDRKKAEDFQKQLNGKAKITKVTKKTKKQFAPQLYDLTALQGEANRLFNLSAKQTLRIMQNLYERYKVLTYPRTDSRVITSDIVPTLQERISAVQGYNKITAQLKQKQLNRLPKSVVNDQIQSDHHAIIPTEEVAYLDDMTNDERKIYDLVVKRFLAVLLDPYEYEETQVSARIQDKTFLLKKSTPSQLGWKALYEEARSESALNYKENEKYKAKVTLKEGETKAPERLTEGSLLKAMENPSHFLEQDEKHLQKTLAETGGIGTVATRADIIEKLMTSQFMELRGKYLYVTQAGRQLLELAPERLRSPALTAEWEKKLQEIEKGKLRKESFISEMKQFTQTIVHDIKGMEARFKHDNITATKCPNCDSFMLEIENKHGKMLRCKDRACNYKRNIYKNSNARCPQCKKKMKLYGEGSGQTFRCVCGHSEKLTTFQKRRKQASKSKVSKRDINKYMKKQEEFTNDALKDALKDLL